MLALAVALWLAITIVPGLAVVRLLRLPGSLLSSVVLSAPVSFGVIYLVGLLATRANASVETVCIVAVALLVFAWLVVEFVRWRRRSTSAGGPHSWTAWRDSWHDPHLAASRLLLLVAIIGGVALWTVSQSRITVPAGWDAMHHGYFVRQIVEQHTLRPQVVLSSDPSRADGTTGFYPLAANLAAALIHVVSGLRISTILLGSTVALAGVVLPLGTFVLVRRLAPNVPLVAGLSAIAAVLPARLYTIDYTGRITVVLGMALVPSMVALALCCGRRIDWRLAVVVPLGAVGISGVHTSELPIAIWIVVAAVVVGALQERVWRAAVAWLAYLVALGAIAGLALYLVDPSIVHLVSERAGSFGPATGAHLPLGISVERSLILSAPFPAHNTVPMAVWSMLAVFGSVVSFHRRFAALAAAGIAYLCWALFFFLLLWSHLGPLASFTDLWYRQSQRMLWEFTVLGAIPVGVALYSIAAIIHTVAVRIRMHGPQGFERRRVSYAGLILAAAVVATLLAVVTPPVRTDAAWLRENASPVNQDSQRAFAYLAAHVGPRQRVLDDLENHGDLWMYVDQGVPTLFGNPPLIGGATVSWKDRLYLRGQLRHIATDPCVGRLLHAYGVDYVFYSKARIWGGKPRISLALLQSKRYFDQVFAAGSVRVFHVRVTNPPAAECTRDTTSPYPWSTLANSN